MTFYIECEYAELLKNEKHKSDIINGFLKQYFVKEITNKNAREQTNTREQNDA